MAYELIARLDGRQVQGLRHIAKALDLAPGPGGSRMSDYTITTEAYEDVLKETFYGRWTRSSLVALYPSSQIVAHRDPPIQGVRHHIPIDLNSGCWVFHGGTWQQLVEGEIYQMDPTQLHGAVNWGPTRRLHLLVDLEAM